LFQKIACLTNRERQVFERVAEGLTNRVIGLNLGISERTVEVHRSHVMKKLEAKSLAHLVKIRLQFESAVQ